MCRGVRKGRNMPTNAARKVSVRLESWSEEVHMRGVGVEKKLSPKFPMELSSL